VRDVELKAAAKMLVKHLKLHNFTYSSGWMWQFRQRHNITNRKIWGEALHGDVESVEPFRKKSDNELDELQESAIKKKLLSSKRDGTDAVINYVYPSTNQQLQK
jgi:hypothetical protein